MKKMLFLVVFSLIFGLVIAQNDTGFKYQAVIRDNSGELLVDQSVDLKLSIIDSISDGIVLYIENHQKNTNSYGVVDLIIGNGTVESGDFTDINWGKNKKYLKIEIDIGSGSTEIGTVELISVPYALFANSALNLGDKNVYSTPSEIDTLFVVKDHDGKVVFAVYPDGVEVIVEESAKGKIGGFAVSGRNPNKAEINDEFLRVTRDSTRVTFNQSSKGKVGGFAVSGRNPNKAGSTSSILNFFPDNYFIGDSAGINTTTGLYNSFIGYKSGKENTTGSYNSFIGYKSGKENTRGSYNFFAGYNTGINNIGGKQNIFIGYKAGFSNVGNTSGDTLLDYLGSHNVFIGDEAGYSNLEGRFNVFIGEGSGYSFINGWYNTAVGFNAALNSTGGIYNLFVGSNSGQSNEGDFNSFVGPQAGQNNTTGDNNTYVGHQSGLSNTTGSENTFVGRYSGRNNPAGSGNIFIGNQAGESESGSNKLYIENSASPTPLIYGDFNLERLSFNGNVGINRNPYSSVSLSVSPAGLAYGIYVDSGSSIYAAYFNGSVYTTGIYDTSDEKFKKNIAPVSQTLKELSNLNAVYYYWKTDEFPDRKFAERKQIGFMAQEVEKSYPELVKKDAEGNRAINYSKFTPILVEAIKEQQKQIEELKKENESLKSSLKEIVDRLDKVEK